MSFCRSLRLPTFLVAVCIAVLSLSAPASAGTVSLAWDPVSHADLVGYRVYRMLIGHIDQGHPARVLDD